MSLVVIVVRDEDDGGVHVSMEAEPQISLKNPEENTVAQLVALRMLNTVRNEAADAGVEPTVEVHS